MTDREIELLKFQIKNNQIGWYDFKIEAYRPVLNIVAGNIPFGCQDEPEPCECLIFNNENFYVCLDNCNLSDFVVLGKIE